MNKGISNCKFCNKLFEYRIRKNRGIYCSRHCQNTANARRAAQIAEAKKKISICKKCNKEFRYKPCDQPGIYCSIICKRKGSKLTDVTKKERMKMYYERDVIRQNNCWDWNGMIYNTGYASIPQGRNKTILAHRASWLIHFGDIPQNMFVLHKCDNPPCTNPKHLFLGTAKDNSIDMIKKGRASGQFQKGLIPWNKKNL
jgi:hypothetical protein